MAGARDCYLNRKWNRLPGHDYSQDGLYFITTNVKDRQDYFGRVAHGQMELNKYGEIVRACWQDLPNHYYNCGLDEFVIMPNHFHGIVIIYNEIMDDPRLGQGFGSDNQAAKSKPRLHGLSEIIRGFKTYSSRGINEQQPDKLFRWHRSFYDRIIRDKESLDMIRRYIRENPIKYHQR